MILVRNLRLEPGEDLSRLSAKAAKKLRVSTSDIAECRVVKRSLDARKKNDIHYTCSAAVALRAGEDKLLVRFAGKDVCAYTEPVYDIPHVEAVSRPIVVGFGPAGMFAALVLARAGARPIVLERGAAKPLSMLSAPPENSTRSRTFSSAKGEPGRFLTASSIPAPMINACSGC